MVVGYLTVYPTDDYRTDGRLSNIRRSIRWWGVDWSNFALSVGRVGPSEERIFVGFLPDGRLVEFLPVDWSSWGRNSSKSWLFLSQGSKISDIGTFIRTMVVTGFN